MNATLRLVEPLSGHTALRTGGSCDAWVVVQDVDALRTVFVDCRAAGWRVLLLGAGTRTVMRDGGFDGVVMRLGSAFCGIVVDDSRWVVGAATPLPALRAHLVAEGFDDLPELASSVGSVGASLLLDRAWRGVYSVTTLRRGTVREESLEGARSRGRVVMLGVTLDPGPRRVAAPERVTSYRCEGTDLFKLLRDTTLPGARLRGITICRAAPELVANLGGGTTVDLQLVQRSVCARVREVHGVSVRSCLRFEGLSAPRRSK